MIVIAQSRNLSMNEVLVHPLGPLPWSLATPDGSLRKTNKATLAKELQRNVPAVDIIPLPSATIIDGMALVQRLKGDHKTFSEVGDALLNMALNESYQSTRIDIVFDVYRSDSIKNSERQNRVTEAVADKSKNPKKLALSKMFENFDMDDPDIQHVGKLHDDIQLLEYVEGSVMAASTPKVKPTTIAEMNGEYGILKSEEFHALTNFILNNEGVVFSQEVKGFCYAQDPKNISQDSQEDGDNACVASIFLDVVEGYFIYRLSRFCS
ncbi:hypothetical protein QZH41_005643 [Actinostola sp. cb2023]|nr:hypothetical protein QZH41_005643 [Actinostola sp. cb2023]